MLAIRHAYHRLFYGLVELCRHTPSLFSALCVLIGIFLFSDCTHVFTPIADSLPFVPATTKTTATTTTTVPCLFHTHLFDTFICTYFIFDKHLRTVPRCPAHYNKASRGRLKPTWSLPHHFLSEVDAFAVFITIVINLRLLSSYPVGSASPKEIAGVAVITFATQATTRTIAIFRHNSIQRRC